MTSEDAHCVINSYKLISNNAEVASNSHNSISNKPDSVSANTQSGINIYKRSSERGDVGNNFNKRLSEIHNSKSETSNRNYISSLRNFSFAIILFSGDEAPYNDFTYCLTIIASLCSPVVG